MSCLCMYMHIDYIITCPYVCIIHTQREICLSTHRDDAVSLDVFLLPLVRAGEEGDLTHGPEELGMRLGAHHPGTQTGGGERAE